MNFQWRGPIRTDHLALLKVSARAFHHVPAGGLHEQFFCEFNGHSAQYAAENHRDSRTQRAGFGAAGFISAHFRMEFIRYFPNHLKWP